MCPPFEEFVGCMTDRYGERRDIGGVQINPLFGDREILTHPHVHGSAVYTGCCWPWRTSRTGARAAS
jgi:hypothetical protein